MSVEEPLLDGELLGLNAATQDLARIATDASIRARLTEIADEFLGLARWDARIWLDEKADHRGDQLNLLMLAIRRSNPTGRRSGFLRTGDIGSKIQPSMRSARPTNSPRFRPERGSSDDDNRGSFGVASTSIVRTCFASGPDGALDQWPREVVRAARNGVNSHATATYLAAWPVPDLRS